MHHLISSTAMLILAAIAMRAYPSWHRSKLIRRCEAQKISLYCSDCIFGIARLTCGVRFCHLRCVDCVASTRAWQKSGQVPTAHTSRGDRRESPSFGFGVRGRNTQCYTGDILGCSCGSFVDFVQRVIRRDSEDVMQRRRYVATQEESAPGP